MISYVFIAINDLLEEVHVGGAQRRQVRLAVAEQEVVELLLLLHLRAEFVDVDLWVCHAYIIVSSRRRSYR